MRVEALESREISIVGSSRENRAARLDLRKCS